MHDKAITRSVIALADSFGLKVIAEGIETAWQASLACSAQAWCAEPSEDRKPP